MGWKGILFLFISLCYELLSHKCPLHTHQHLVSEPNLPIRTLSDTSNSCYEIKIGTEWKTYCYPSLIVAGFPKCGSSFIFKMLSSHPHIIPTQRKELCLGGILSETWSKFFTFLPNVTASRNKLVMSGCLHLGANIKAMQELCVQQLKVIYVLRDVADMLWSAYNFWCIPNYDENCYPGKHTSKLAIRTPQHFHEMILQSQDMGGGIPLTKSGNCYQQELEDALSHFGIRNVLVIKSEMMLNERDKLFTIQEIQSFLYPETIGQGLLSDGVKNWIKTQSQTIYRVNSGRSINSRGEKIIDIADQKGQVAIDEGLYEVSNYQPMLQETRKIIYERWSKECRWLKEKYHIHYSEAC